ncbi:MAG: hypothetical protein M3Y07_15130 [Acidobacteriota bacterium]|nr:hypothetical protein [Acidobacteriota bacterium]
MKRALLPALILGIGLMSGCAVRAGYMVPPPPAPRVEYYGYAPGPGYVWSGGYWVWGGRGYDWTGGRWLAPPRPRARFAQGHYARRHGTYFYVPGRWR